MSRHPPSHPESRPDEQHERDLRTIASAPLGQIQQHFTAMCGQIQNRFSTLDGLSPTTVGDTRETVIREFLNEHLPGKIGTRRGHILYGNSPSKQQDIIIYDDSSLALPLGPAGLFLPEGVIACVEVKSVLTKSKLIDQVSATFASLQQPQPLKVLVCSSLEPRKDKEHLYRRLIRKWALAGKLSIEQLPDIIIVLNVGTVIRGSSIRVASHLLAESSDPAKLYKYGAFRDMWLGFALLVFEISYRATKVDWAPHLTTVFPSSATDLDADLTP
jgi:hypothetical protein